MYLACASRQDLFQKQRGGKEGWIHKSEIQMSVRNDLFCQRSMRIQIRRAFNQALQLTAQ